MVFGKNICEESIEKKPAYFGFYPLFGIHRLLFNIIIKKIFDKEKVIEVIFSASLAILHW